jgi:hypothetical protein
LDWRENEKGKGKGNEGAAMFNKKHHGDFKLFYDW